MRKRNRMNRKIMTFDMLSNSKKACAAICCVLILFAASMQMQRVSAAASSPQILISPTYIKLTEGQNFSVTVNLTNDDDLYLFEIALEYNASILNLTGTSVPDNSVFAGHNSVAPPEPTDKEVLADSKTGFNWTMVGASLFGMDTVSVTNGILCVANFTALGAGSTYVKLMVYAEPVTYNGGPPIGTSFYTYLVDSNFDTLYNLQTIGCTVVVGTAIVNVPPVALFTAVPEVFDIKNNLVINGSTGNAGQNSFYAYANYSTEFNATYSFAVPPTNLTEYIWNFGDGTPQVTVDANGTDTEYIDHVFMHIGTYTVVLTVWSSGIPEYNMTPLSNNYTLIALVGIVLPLYNWTPFVYTVLGLFVALMVMYIVRSIVRHALARRRMKELKKSTLPTAGPSGQPPPVG